MPLKTTTFQTNHITRLFWLVAILLLGAALRIVHLGAQSIWGDEGFTVYAIQQPDVIGTVARDVHPPAYFGLLALWSRIAGMSEVALRLPSVWFSLLNVALIYVVAKEFLRLRMMPVLPLVPMLAALLLAIAEMENYTAQEARSYAAHVTLALLSMLAFLRWRRTNHAKWTVLWVLANALLIYTHYLGVWTLIAQGVFLLLFQHKRWWRGVVLLVLSVLSLLPWVLGAMHPFQFDKFGRDLPAYPSTLETFWQFRIPFFTQQWALMMGLLLLGTVILVKNQRVQWRPFTSSALLWLWLMVPVAGTYLLNLNSGRMLYDYRISQITVPIALLTAFGLAHFRRVTLAFLTAVIVIYGVIVVDMYRPKEVWRDYTAQLTRFIAPGDALLLDFTGGDYTVTYYAQRLLPAETPVFSLWQRRNWHPDTYEADSIGFANAYDTVWVGAWTDVHEAKSKLRLTNHQLTARETFDHVGNTWEILRYDRVSNTEPVAMYENGMQLRRVMIDAEKLRVDLLWSTETPLDADYTTSVLLMNETGQVVAQFDSPPYFNQHPTSTWTPDDLIYDPKPLELTNGALPAGTYQVAVQVYRWSPDVIEQIRTSEGEDFAEVGFIGQP